MSLSVVGGIRVPPATMVPLPLVTTMYSISRVSVMAY
jgi:hypothetical protein